MVKFKLIYIILFLTIFIFGCSNTEQQMCVNQTIIVNHTIEVPIETIKYVNVTVLSPSCVDRQAIVEEYKNCLINLSKAENTLSTDCETRYANCNDTLKDCQNRLNNITWYINKNR